MQLFRSMVKPSSLGFIAAMALAAMVVVFLSSGTALVVDNRQKSDEIVVVVPPSSPDSAFWMSLRLLGAGYGREMIVDARTNLMIFGLSHAERMQVFVSTAASSFPKRVRICPVTADLTVEEAHEVGNCLKETMAHSVLLVVSDYRSRRALSIFSRILPQYRWSVASVPEPQVFGQQWWQKRVWIRTAIIEWERVLWWEAIDRWRTMAPGASDSQL